MKHNRLRTFPSVLLFLLALGSSACADVLRLKDGTVYFGAVVSADSSGLVFDVFGEKLTVDQKDILKTEPDLASLRELPLEVTLKDGSVIRGRILDYDEEVGFLVDIDFGAVTVPVQSLKVIEDPAQRNRYRGYPLHLGLTGGYYGTAGSLSSDFGGNFNFSLYAELNTRIVRGLYAGLDASYFFVNFQGSEDLSYSIATVTPYAMYRLLALRSYKSFIRNFVPHASLGAGLAYVGVRDERADAYPEKYGEVNLAVSTALGFDYFVTERIFLRLKGGWLFIPQQSSALNLLTVNIGGAYCL